MRTERSIRRGRRIGIALLLLGLVPLIVFATALTASRLSGGGLSIPGDDLRSLTFHAENVGFEKTTPSSTVSVRITVSRKDSWGPRLAWMPWYLRSDFELSGELFRADTRVTTVLTATETAKALRQSAPVVSEMLAALYRNSKSDDPAVVMRMVRQGEMKRRETGIMWRNVAMDTAGWLGGWWKGCSYVVVMITGAVLWGRNRAVPAGHCLECGYDLRGNPEGGFCPECGMPGARETPGMSVPSEP